MAIMRSVGVSVVVLCLASSARSELTIPPHIANAPVGEWTAIGANVAADVQYSPSPAGDFSGIMDAWSGGAYSPVTHRLYIHGGTHNSYGGNEVYAFQLDLNSWVRVTTPSPYDGNGVWAGGVFPDGYPQPNHTYGEMPIDPRTDTLYRLSAAATGTNVIWKLKVGNIPMPTPGWLSTESPNIGPYGGSYDWDPVSGSFYGGGNNSAFFDAYSYSPDENKLTKITPNDVGFAPGLYPAVAIDSVRREMIVVGGAGTSSPGGFWRRGTVTYNLDSRKWTNRTDSTTGDKVPETDSNGAIAYDPRRGVIYYWTGGGDTRTIYRLDTATWVWDTISPTSGAVPDAQPSPSGSNGTYGRFRYAEEYDLLMVVTKTNGRVFIYKPENWNPGEILRPEGPSPLVAE